MPHIPAKGRACLCARARVPLHVACTHPWSSKHAHSAKRSMVTRAPTHNRTQGAEEAEEDPRDGRPCERPEDEGNGKVSERCVVSPAGLSV
jgi:hypothetical protein